MYLPQGVTREDLERAEQTLQAAGKGSQSSGLTETVAETDRCSSDDKSDKENKPEEITLSLRRKLNEDPKKEARYDFEVTAADMHIHTHTHIYCRGEAVSYVSIRDFSGKGPKTCLFLLRGFFTFIYRGSLLIINMSKILFFFVIYLLFGKVIRLHIS